MENLEEFVNSIIKGMVEKNINFKDFLGKILDSFCRKYGVENILFMLSDKLSEIIEKNPEVLGRFISLNNLDSEDLDD